MQEMYDVVIIGAGAVGCAIARELSRYSLRVAVLEKDADVAGETSGRNSAVVHAGFNNRTGSLMARLCVRGSQCFEAVCRTLDVPYRKTGKLLVAFDRADMESLETILRQGERNGCRGLRTVSKEELHALVPDVGGIGGMLSPETAIFDPFTYCVALAENAVENGVRFYLNHEVTGISSGNGGGFRVLAGSDAFSCRFLINAAGLYADRISEMAGVSGYRIYPCRGEYYILDKIADPYLPLPVYPVPRPGAGGLGVHLTPTIDGNILIGPSADYIGERDDYACTAKTMDELFREAKQLLPVLERRHIIGSYAGIRPKQTPPDEGGFRDFVIREEPNRPGLINLIGIESPGLTASVPIAETVRDILAQKTDLKEKREYVANRRGILRFREQSPQKQAELIAMDPEYGEIVCRCQNVTKHEIREAIENPLGARSLSAIKYRAWATTGRCGGGYCLTRIVNMLIREYGLKPSEITWREKGSELFAGEAK